MTTMDDVLLTSWYLEEQLQKDVLKLKMAQKEHAQKVKVSKR